MNGDLSKYSDEEAYRIAKLVAGFIRGTLSEKEHYELDEWVAASDENMLLFERLTDPKNMEEAVNRMEKVDTEKALEEIKKRIVFKRPGKMIRLWQYVAAACLVITAGVLVYFFSNTRNNNDHTVITENNADITPGTEKATLKFDNGKIIYLDVNGADTSIGENILLQRQNGAVVYTGEDPKKTVEYHELTIPRKGFFKLVLPDGSKAWLNSESSIRYPTVFLEKERKVSIGGEVFFEVAKNKEKPFIVETGKTRIEALGTAFNVNAYANEPFLSATLVEGSILVSNGNHENILKPGQQVQINDNDFEIINIEAADVIAWKDGMFKFTNAPIETIMRQVERWYDASVVYDYRPTDHFNADLPREVPVSKLLYYLELTKRVHFKIEKNTITVLK